MPSPGRAESPLRRLTESNDMQSGTTILGRGTRSARRHARRAQGARRINARSVRAAVAEAFRRMANGIDGKAAYASTVAFYRSGGQEWTAQLA